MSRRFIAGAVCPRCGLQDKLLVDSDAGLRECVNCGFSDERPLTGTAEPKTRVTRPAARRLDTPLEVVNLIPPGTPAEDPGNSSGESAATSGKPPAEQDD